MTQIPFPSIRESKTELFEQFARVGKALSSGLRIEILDLLGQSERSVETLADMLNQSVQNISRHLQILRQTKLIASRKDGNFVFYRLASEDIRMLVSNLQGVAHKQLAEVDDILERFASHSSEFEALDATELMKRAKSGKVVVLDVRPKKEYDTAHLPHSLNVPLSELERRLSELPEGAEIVAYCRGRYCLMAFAAVDFLQSKGLVAARLSVGLSEWKLQHQPVVAGEDAGGAADDKRRKRG